MSKKRSSIKEEIFNSQNKGSVPVLELVKDRVTASVVSKIISDDTYTKRVNKNGERELLPPDYVETNRISQEKMQDITDAESVMQMLPDLELGAQILISCILSPKDMQTVEIIHNPPEKIFPPSVVSIMVNKIRDFLTNDYKIEPRLPLILRDILFNTGSYPVAVIPENSIDEIINGVEKTSMESLIDHGFLEKIRDTDNSFIKSLGLLGSPNQNKNKKKLFSLENYSNEFNLNSKDYKINFSLENLESSSIENNELFKLINEENKQKINYEDSDLFTVTDNYAALSFPFLLSKIKEESIYGKLNSPTLEDFNGRLSNRDIELLLNRKIDYGVNYIKKVKTSDQCFRSSVGEPLVMHFPSESVINVYVPGTTSESVGHFIVCDENCYPISRNSEVDHYRDLYNASNNNKNLMASNLIDKAKTMNYGFRIGDDLIRERINYAAKTYGEIIENDLLNRLKNGVYGSSVKISNYTEIYRVMLARALKQQRTQLIFIPSELMTYMAFNYDNNGIGYSLLDKLKVINSLAVHLLLANVRSGVMNSIPRTKVDVQLDEDTPDNLKTRNIIMHEYLMLRQSGNNGMPLGTSDPVSITEWANRAGLEFSFSGDPSQPDMKIDISEHSSDQPKADSDLIDELKRLRLNGIGLTPEIVDASNAPDFATSIIQESLLFARRTQQKQNEFIPYLSDHIRKLLLNSPKMIASLKEVIEENFDSIVKLLLPESKDEKYDIDDQDKEKIKSKLIKVFIEKYEVSLPKPDSLSITAKSEAFGVYMDSVSKAIEYYISKEAIPEQYSGENMQDVLETIKNMVISHFARKWMSENDFLTELADMITLNEEGESQFNLLEVNKDFVEKMIKSIGGVLASAKPVAKSTDAVLSANELVDEEQTDTSDSDDDSFGYSNNNDNDDSFNEKEEADDLDENDDQDDKDIDDFNLDADDGEPDQV